MTGLGAAVVLASVVLITGLKRPGSA